MLHKQLHLYAKYIYWHLVMFIHYKTVFSKVIFKLL